MGCLERKESYCHYLWYGGFKRVPVWLICCPYNVFENDKFDNFAVYDETLDTLSTTFQRTGSAEDHCQLVSLDPLFLSSGSQSSVVYVDS
jgi:hypothetical protein